MDTHFKATLVLSKCIGKNIFEELPVPLKTYSDLIDIDFSKDTHIVKEYHDLKLKIHSSNNSRLYFDGFDVLESDVLAVDENGDKFLSNGEIDLYKHANNEINNVLVPGYYLLKIVSENTYYSIIEIVPKDLEKKEWQMLYSDVKDFFNVSSNSLLNRSNSKVSLLQKNNNYLDKMNYIIERYNILMKSINRIKENPRQKIKKSYNLTNKNHQPKIDKITIKMQSKHPNIKDSLYACKREVNYNTKENIWIKLAINYLYNSLNDLIKNIGNFMDGQRENTESNFSNERERAQRTLSRSNYYINIIENVKNNLLKIKQEPWFIELNTVYDVAPPNESLMDINYNTIYKWYNEFNKSQLDLLFSEKVQNSWRRTDELYEIWCFIKIIEKLQELGFEAEDGWVFGKEEFRDLEEGTIIRLTKNKVRINLHYNSLLKSTSKSTNIVHPLYTNNSKKKPDLRIDIHINDIYMKSIPIEVKYRKLRQITDKSNNVYKQLMSYRNGPNSKIHLLGAREFRRKNHTVITKVVVLYPKDRRSNVNTNTLTNDYGIEFVELSPNYIDTEIDDLLKRELDDMEEIYNDIYL